MNDLAIGPARLGRLGTLSYAMILAVVISSTLSALVTGDYLTGALGQWYLVIGNRSLLEHAVLADVILLFSSYIVVGCWIYRAHANLRDRDLDGLEFSPGWAIGWFAVPIANLFKPFQAMRELYSRSMFEDEGDTPPKLYAWWSTWLLSGFLSFNIAGDMSWFDIASNACTVVSAVSLFFIIRDVTTAQQGEPMTEIFA